MSTKHLQVRDITLEGGKPSVCAPLTGENKDQLLHEAAEIAEKEPDVVEWRADFFDDIDNSQAIIDTASVLRGKLGEIPILFTIRSEKEGGQSIPLNEPGKVELLKKVCETRSADLVDYEVNNNEEDIINIRIAAKNHGVKLVLSFHHFTETPGEEILFETLQKAEKLQADAGKIAVMPQSMQDVLILLQVTQKADQELNIPIITMSMGPDGGLTRLVGWKFGSAMTFAVGSKSSAPGQIPIEVVRQLEGYLRHE